MQILASTTGPSGTTDIPGSRQGQTPEGDQPLSARVFQILCRWRYALAAVWVSVAFIAMMGHAHQKPFWSDEEIFRWIAMEPSVHAIYRDLLGAIDLDPPVAQVVTHFTIALLGSGQIAVRIPSIVGVCSALLCLFLALEIYVDSLFALIALVVPFASLLIDYGWEARPYGLMYGFLAFAVLSWCQLGKDRVRRGLWTAALAASLTLMLGCHFYSVFALPAFILAEFIRTRRQARISWATWLAILGASATELFYLPIMAAAHQYSDGYFGTPNRYSLANMFGEAFPTAGLLLFIFLVFAALLALGATLVQTPRLASNASANRQALDREFAALAIGLSLIPVLGWLAGLFFLKAFVTRYVLHGLIGLFLLLPLVASRLSKGNPILAFLLILTFACQGMHVVAAGISDLMKAPDPMRSAYPFVARPFDLTAIQSAVSRLHGDIVVSDSHVLIQLANYSPELKARCIYLADRGMEMEFTGKTTSTHEIDALSRVGWVRESPWSEYRQSGFLLLTTSQAGDDQSWVTTEVEQSQRRGPVVATAGKYVILQVNPLP
jgi:hypothetical protein